MREIDVIRATRSHLQAHGLAGHPVVDLYTDAHPTLTADAALRPFQRFTLPLDGLAVSPDLVGCLADGETTFAIEAKGTDDLLKGLAQAQAYRLGFHRALLASAGTPPPDLVTLARQQHVGIIAVYPNQVRVLELPPAHLPRLDLARSVQQQLATTQVLATAFTFNLPTHYLSIAIALHHTGARDRDALEAQLRAAYPVLPKGTTSFRGALRGAQKLGLVNVRGNQVEPTMAGEAVGLLLPDLPALAAVHTALVGPGGGTLAQRDPAAGAVLRWLLAGDAVAQLIRETLTDLGGGPTTMPQLARQALARGRAQALVAFFQPEAIEAITDGRGNVVWERVQPRHYRSTTFFQYKSVLKHAGVIMPHRLGGGSSTGYNPDADVWELAVSPVIEHDHRPGLE